MFSRRRAASNPASRNPPSASASLAASKAFINSRDSNPSLSSAAAAAALRHHVTTSTPVGDIVTKRMARKGSLSSNGSGSPRPQGLRRHSSSGSMAERTFRAPSPNRGSPSVDHTRNAPPVPALPQDVPGMGAVHRRASSLEPPFRVASPAGRGEGRGGSLDRGAAVAPPRSKRVMSLQQVPEYEQDGSPRSINFSRPMSPSPGSTANSSPVTQRSSQGGWFTAPAVNTEQAFRGGNTVRPKPATGVSPYDMHSAQQAVQNAADRPVSKHTNVNHGAEGARLTMGSMHAKPSGTAISRQPHIPIDPKSPDAVYDPSTRTFIHKQTAMAKHRAMNEEEEEEEPIDRYVIEHGPSPRVPIPPQQRVSQPSPVPFRDISRRSPSPPPQRIEETTKPVHSAADDEEGQNAGAELARHASEDYASVDIRPSTHANEVDSALPESKREAAESPISPRLAANQESPYPRLGTPVMSTSTNKKATQDASSVGTDRTHSLSPPRNAHFAAVAIELPNGVKHQPPPRSVSPAKSALKPSPSVSRRSSSPMVNGGRAVSRFAPSDASDTMSDDGIKKKKKNVRVSFDEEAVVAGTSAYTEAERPSSPSSTELSQSRRISTTHEQDLEDVMTPRPVLPSFGSIRDKNRNRDGGEVPEKVTETVSSSMSTSVASVKEPLETSSDHAVGGVLARDFATKQGTQPGSRDPLPPEVTSVEGSGYYSDSDQSDTVPDGSIAEVVSETTPTDISLPEPKTLTTSTDSNRQIEHKPAAIEVPAIAVQPASPAPTETVTVEQRDQEPKYQSPFIPGSWADDEEPNEVSIAQLSPRTNDPVKDPIVEKAETLTAPVVRDDETTDEDTSSIYSDAYEELTDTEDGGFASIDAVVESPVTKAPQGLSASRYANDSPAESAKPAQRDQTISAPEQVQALLPKSDWEPARQHWRGLMDSRRQQQEVGSEERIAEPVPISTAPVIPPPKAQSGQARLAEREPPTEVAVKAPKLVQASRIDTLPQPRKSAMKKTVAPTQPAPYADTHMRKTMRSNMGPQQSYTSDSHMRSSMRSNETMGASRTSPGLAASRYSMPPPETKPPKGALQKRHIPPPPAAAAAVVPRSRPQSAGLPVNMQLKAAVPKYDSDSDGSVSSFKRERRRPRSSRGGSDRYTMRRSMRGDAAPTMREASPMRTSSPPVATSLPPPTSLRKSMRPSSPLTEPSATRSSRFSIRSLSPAGRFRQSKVTPVNAPPMPAQKALPKKNIGGLGKQSRSVPTATDVSRSKFKSRFDDSSDEEDGGRPAFQSRFADSDDEDDYVLPPGLAPVRGIPKKAGEEDRDSTDLEDEDSDEEPSTAKTAEKDMGKGELPLTNGHKKVEGPSVAAGSLRKKGDKPMRELPTFDLGTKAKAKRGFFGFGKKKSVSPEAPEVEMERSSTDSTDIPMPPPHRDRVKNRALTPIGEDDMPNTNEPHRSPKLQRRGTPQFGRSTSDSWPLPIPPKIGEEARPQSADGIVPFRSTLRPTLSKRQSSHVSDSSIAGTARTAIDPKTGKEVTVGRTGKKKKFQGLRRVFGLND